MDKEDGVDVDNQNYTPDSLIATCLSTFENYRLIRIEEAYFSKIPNNLSELQIRQKLVEYDHQRRNYHNTALSAVNMLNRVMNRLQLPAIYQGPVMTDKEIENHTNLDTRNMYTDFFLDLNYQLENFNIAGLPDSVVKNLVINILRTIRKNSRGYGLKEPFLHDDGDIVFDDETFER